MMEQSLLGFESQSAHNASTHHFNLTNAKRNTAAASQDHSFLSWIKEEENDDISSHRRAENQGLLKGSDELARPKTGQEGRTAISFHASPEIFTLWQKLRQEHWLDDSQLAAKLLLHYEDTLQHAVCSSCQSSLNHFCSTCFVLAPNPERSQLQNRSASSGDEVGNTGDTFEGEFHKQTSEISDTAFAFPGEFKGTTEAGNSELEESPQADDTEVVFPEVLQETLKLSDNEDAFHDEIEGISCHQSFCAENSVTEEEVGIGNQAEQVNKVDVFPTMEAGGNEFADYGENVVACVFCDISFPSVQDLSRHLMTHTRVQWQQLHQPATYRTSKRMGRIPRPCNEDKHKAAIELAEAEENDSTSTDEASGSFKCIYCGTMYKKAVTLTKHLQKHLKTSAFKCCGCLKFFTALTELETHIYRFKCNSNKACEDRPHHCRICGMRFRHIGYLVKHTSKHTEPQPFWCPQCKSAFQFLADYTGHQCQMTSEGKSKLQPVEPHPFKGFDSGDISLEQIHENPDFSYSEDILQCSLKEVVEHKKITVAITKSGRPENIVTNQHQHAFNKDNIPEESATESGKSKSKKSPKRLSKKDHIFKCPECPSVFKYASGLKTHSQKHTGQNAFPCTLCVQTFSSKRGLLMHQEKDHWGSAPITCHECGRVVKSALSLDQHMRLHTGERPLQCHVCDETFKSHTDLYIHRRTHMTDCYKCRECGDSFNDSTLYKTHMMKHSGFRPYLCSVCGDAFAQQPQLKKHLAKHGQKQYVCEHCGQAFYTGGEHKLHVMRHLGIKPHACELCGKRFIKKEKLKRHHQSVHVQEKPYKCTLCPVAYKDVSRLNEHIRATHTNERPYKCPVCGKAFAKSGCRQAHLRIHKRNGK